MKIIIENIAIPIGEIDQKKFEAPDLLSAFDYYPFFLRHSKIKISPAQYLEEILSIVGSDGATRTELLNKFAHYIENFPARLEDYYKLFLATK